MDFVKNTEVLVIISQFFISKVNILQSRDTLERTSLMSQSLFESYDLEYESLSADIQRNIGELKSLKGESDQLNGRIRQIEALLSQANDLIKQMNVEVRSQDATSRKELTERVMQYQKTIKSHKIDFDRAREQAQRSSLIGEKSSADRQRLLDTNEKLNKQNQIIMNATRTVAETEEVGLEITAELNRNREKIQSAHAKVREFGGITDSARRLLSSMARRDVQQKFILFFIAIVLIIAIVVTVYFLKGPGSH